MFRPSAHLSQQRRGLRSCASIAGTPSPSPHRSCSSNACFPEPPTFDEVESVTDIADSPSSKITNSPIIEQLDWSDIRSHSDSFDVVSVQELVHIEKNVSTSIPSEKVAVPAGSGRKYSLRSFSSTTTRGRWKSAFDKVRAQNNIPVWLRRLQEAELPKRVQPRSQRFFASPTGSPRDDPFGVRMLEQEESDNSAFSKSSAVLQLATLSILFSSLISLSSFLPITFVPSSRSPSPSACLTSNALFFVSFSPFIFSSSLYISVLYLESCGRPLPLPSIPRRIYLLALLVTLAHILLELAFISLGTWPVPFEGVLIMLTAAGCTLTFTAYFQYHHRTRRRPTPSLDAPSHHHHPKQPVDDRRLSVARTLLLFFLYFAAVVLPVLAAFSALFPVFRALGSSYLGSTTWVFLFRLCMHLSVRHTRVVVGRIFRDAHPASRASLQMAAILSLTVFSEVLLGISSPDLLNHPSQAAVSVCFDLLHTSYYHFWLRHPHLTVGSRVSRFRPFVPDAAYPNQIAVHQPFRRTNLVQVSTTTAAAITPLADSDSDPQPRRFSRTAHFARTTTSTSLQRIASFPIMISHGSSTVPPLHRPPPLRLPQNAHRQLQQWCSLVLFLDVIAHVMTSLAMLPYFVAAHAYSVSDSSASEGRAPDRSWQFFTFHDVQTFDLVAPLVYTTFALLLLPLHIAFIHLDVKRRYDVDLFTIGCRFVHTHSVVPLACFAGAAPAILLVRKQFNTIYPIMGTPL